MKALTAVFKWKMCSKKKKKIEKKITTKHTKKIQQKSNEKRIAKKKKPYGYERTVVYIWCY